MARSFNGTSDSVVDTTIASTVRDNWTISGFINISTLPQSFNLAIYNGEDGGAGPFNGYGFGVMGTDGASGSKLIGLYGGIAFKNTSYTFSSTDVWYHVVMTRNSGTLRFYVDGTDVGYTDTNADNGVPSGSFTMGCQDRNSEGFVAYFAGRICHAAIWERALSTGEITNLAAGFSPLFYTASLKRYYPLSGRFSPELSTTGHSATVSGALIYPDPPKIIYPFHDKQVIGNPRINRRKIVTNKPVNMNFI